MANQFVGYDNIIPLVAPVAGTTGTITSPYMNLKNAQKASFLISWGAVTTVAAATGCVAITGAAGDDTALWVEIDPDALAASDYSFVRFVSTPTASMEAFVIGAVGILEARYKQTTHISATASASA